MPRVSVIVPTYNSAATIAETLDSVLTQTVQDIEVIVVDDGSTDHTAAVVAPYAGRIQYIRRENQGRSAARNYGIELSTGELIAFVDSDDVWLPEKLEKQLPVLEQYPRAVLTSCPACNIDAAGQPISYRGSYYLGHFGSQLKVHQHDANIIFGTPIIPSSVVVHRQPLQQVGLFDTQLSLGEDWELWVRLSRLGPFVHTPHPLLKYRADCDKEIRKRASDYLVSQSVYLINKSADADPDRFPPALRDKALANTYLYSALASYELGDAVRGQKMLTQAIELNGELAQQTRLTFLLEDQARRIIQDTGAESGAVKMLTFTLENLPPQVAPTTVDARQILGRVYIADAFKAHAAGDKKTTRQVLWSGVRYDPSWLLNRGVLSMMARSMWG